MGSISDPDELARGTIALARAPLEHHALDVRWREGTGSVLARFAGARPRPQAEAAAQVLDHAGLSAELDDDDAELWDEQRAAPARAARGEGLRASEPAGGRPAGRRRRRRLARGPWRTGTLVDPHRGALGQAVERLRRTLAPSPCAVLDRPPDLELDVWGPARPAYVALMERVKRGFDPAGVCSPGVLAGGL